MSPTEDSSAPPAPVINWLMLILPIVLLLPFAFPLLALPQSDAYLPEWLQNAAGVFCLTAFFLGPLVLLIVPLIAILSIAVVYESMREWFAANRTGTSLGVAALWMGPSLLYGCFSLWPLLLFCF